MKIFNQVGRLAAISLLGLLSTSSQAAIDGINGTLVGNERTFNLFAQQFNIPTPDGDIVPMWGYGKDGGVAQYPGPTLIANEGETVTINLSNQLPLATSIVLPGQADVTVSGGVKGLITNEVPADLGATSVSYSFTAKPGTYVYESGTNPTLQNDMGLIGAIVVRPTGFDKTTISVGTVPDGLGGTIQVDKANPNQTAYGHPESHYDYEYLWMLTEIDPVIHKLIAQGNLAAVDFSQYKATMWFINGRAFPDTVSPADDPAFPNQPYNVLPLAKPGEKILLRMIGGSGNMHPIHPHGAQFQEIAKDGRLLESQPGNGPDLGRSDNTQPAQGGQTYDMLFVWDGKQLGWDIYGEIDPLSPNFRDHDCTDLFDNAQGGIAGAADGFDDVTYEWCEDHGVPLPVTLPSVQDLAFGGFYSGSPYLGAESALPPEEGGLNVGGGYMFPWHSHTEKQLANNDIFPGGQFTALVVVPYVFGPIAR